MATAYIDLANNTMLPGHFDMICNHEWNRHDQLSFLLQVLFALRQRPFGQFIEYRNAGLFVDGEPFLMEGLSGSSNGLSARVALLLRHWGIDEANERTLFRHWMKMLEPGDPIRVADLQRVAMNSLVGHQRDEQPDGDILQASLKAMFAARNILYDAPPRPATTEEESVEQFHSNTDMRLEKIEPSTFHQIEAAFAEMPTILIEDVWVPVRLIRPGDTIRPIAETDDGPLESALPSLLERRYRARRGGSFDPELFLDGLHGTTVIIGDPGSGKTTLLKWLANKLTRRHLDQPMIPIWISLQEYASRQMRPGLIEYGLSKCGIRSPHRIEVWRTVIDKSASIGRGFTVLLLDGWDEVPAGLRHDISIEIAELRARLPIIVTTRPSGIPRSIGAERYFEIVELEPADSTMLVHAWFESANGQAATADALLATLEGRKDLRRIWRNPFLLTILCAVYFRTDMVRSSLPATRGEVYDLLLTMIATRPEIRADTLPWSTSTQRQIERLAWWMMALADKAPIYVFDADDLESHAGCKPNLLNNFLLPHRLISQWHHDRQTLHFVHTTFQEFFAAYFISRLDTQSAEPALANKIWDLRWFEVFALLGGLAGSASSESTFWQQVRNLIDNRDRYGLTIIRAARLAAEVGGNDTCEAACGVNLCQELWKELEKVKSEYWSVFLNASATLDLNWHTNKCVQALRELELNESTEQVRQVLQLHLSELETLPAVSEVITLSTLANASQSNAWARWASGGLSPVDRVRIYEHLEKIECDAAQLKDFMYGLRGATDQDSVDLLGMIAFRYASDIELFARTLFNTAVAVLGDIGGPEAFAELDYLLSIATDDWVRQARIVSAIGEVETIRARDRLLELLAETPIDGSLAGSILQALGSFEIRQWGELIVDFLSSSDDHARAAAAKLCKCVRGVDVAPALMDLAGDREQPTSVRIGALCGLFGHAGLSELKLLSQWTFSPAHTRSLDEREHALAAVVELANRNEKAFAQIAGKIRSAMLDGEIETVQLGLQAVSQLRADLRRQFVSEVGQRICESTEADIGIQIMAINVLAQIDSADAVNVLLTLKDAEGRYDGMAAAAIADLDPVQLLDDPDANGLLRAYSFEHGALVFKDRIIDSRGCRIERRFGEPSINPLEIAIYKSKDGFVICKSEDGFAPGEAFPLNNDKVADLFELLFSAGGPKSYRAIRERLWPNSKKVALSGRSASKGDQIAPLAARLRAMLQKKLRLGKFNPVNNDEKRQTYSLSLQCARSPLELKSLQRTMAERSERGFFDS